MELSWELEQLGRAAAPDVVLEGRRLVPQVSDVTRHDDGSVDALFRGEVAHAVSIPARFPLDGFSCTCRAGGRFRPCLHVIAVMMRNFQLFHGLDDARTARWQRHVESLRALYGAWSGLADVWLEAFREGDDTAAGAVLRDAGSMYSAVEIARALGSRATVAECSAFLVRMAAHYDVDGAVPLGPWAIAGARLLADSFWTLRDQVGPEACTGLLLALAGSARRAGTDPVTDWQVENIFTSACSALGQLVVDGHVGSSTVAHALLDAELGAPSSSSPWGAFMVDALASAAPQVASAMRERLSALEPDGGWASVDEPLFRLRAEIGLVSGGVPGVVAVLEEWPEAPYDEFLRRLPLTLVPTERIEFLESAHRSGRTAWSPGWAPRPPASYRRNVHQLHRVPRPVDGSGRIAIGELVLAEAQLGRLGAARNLLRGHAQRHADPAHRYEFHRIWAAAKLGEGSEASATEIFGPELGDGRIGELLAAISQLHEAYFDRVLTAAESGLGASLLTAVLLEDIPSEGDVRTLDASTWADSFLSLHPNATDDLSVLASVPDDAVSDWLEGAVLDRHLALRSQTIARQLVENGCQVRNMADLRRVGLEVFVEALEQVPAATPMTTALLALLLGDPRHPALDSELRRFLRNALTNEPPEDSTALVEMAHTLEPRCADLRAYQLGIILADLDGRAPYRCVRP